MTDGPKIPSPKVPETTTKVSQQAKPEAGPLSPPPQGWTEQQRALAGLSDSLRPTFDEVDAVIVKEAMAVFDQIEGPRPGDFVRFQDGSLHRLTKTSNTEGIQTSQTGSFCLFKWGSMDFSGSLEPHIRRARLTRLDETREGEIWTFHHGNVGAFKRVDCTAPFRVYAYNDI